MEVFSAYHLVGSPAQAQYKMRFAIHKILFLISVVLGSFSLFSPWATVSYRVGETEEQLSLPVSILDDSLIVGNCIRGSAFGQDESLDQWI